MTTNYSHPVLTFGMDVRMLAQRPFLCQEVDFHGFTIVGTSRAGTACSCRTVPSLQGVFLSIHHYRSSVLEEDIPAPRPGYIEGGTAIAGGLEKVCSRATQECKAVLGAVLAG